MTKIKTILIILIVIILVGVLIAPYFLARSIYDKSFNEGYKTDVANWISITRFETLTNTRYTFPTKQGHELVGYLYEQKDPEQQKKGVIVFAHGLGGGGQNGYMEIFNYLTERGYYVFAYDATANDESDGDVVGGLPQGFIDLDYAIDFAYTIEEIRDLPFMLMGYSWGGLSVVNVLNYHPEVEAVVSLAGWNESMDMIEHTGREKVGNIVKLFMPYARLHEYLKYGDYASSTAMKGFAASDCNVMIVHGAKDTVVPIEYGFDTYHKVYGNDERFVFKKYEDRDHGLMNKVDGSLDYELMTEIADFFDKSLEK